MDWKQIGGLLGAIASLLGMLVSGGAWVSNLAAQVKANDVRIATIERRIDHMDRWREPHHDETKGRD